MTNRPPFTRAAGLIIPLVLIAATYIVYYQVRDFDFILLDDGQYVLDNPHVQKGLTAGNIIWAWTTTSVHNWHPLTWLSYMLDFELYGLDPGQFHMTNVLFHMVNTLLLFLVLNRMTGAVWRSAVVAGLFAWHPLHVESVAWIAERKDVLSTLFWFTTLWAYMYYHRKRTILRCGLVFISFAAGLAAKPMLVTLPFTLLLLDYWPLGRIETTAGQGAGRFVRENLHLVVEKIPLFLLSLASSAVTLYAQSSGGAYSALHSFRTFSLGHRIGNALISYAEYIGKTFWPFGLSAYYPAAADRVTLLKAGMAGLLLVAVTALALRQVRKRPYFIVGWLWFLGTLAPVIGLVQVGSQSLADRYTYVPLIGLFIALAWGAGDLAADRPARRKMAAALAGIVLVGCLAIASVQIGYWRDTRSVFSHALEVTPDNPIAHLCLGIFSRLERKPGEAERHLKKAVEVRPSLYPAHRQLGSVMFSQGRYREAAVYLERSLKLNPGAADARRLLLESRRRLKAAPSGTDP